MKITTNPKRLVSASDVGHYTKEFKNLESILSSKSFNVCYCPENYFFIEAHKEDYIPMVCFTDLPEGISGKHQRRYGYYVIVLTKDWCNKHKISPIIYLRKDGRMTDIIRHIYNSSKNIGCQILAFCKPYCARYREKDGSMSKENRRFYDEREWRYVPDNYLPYNGQKKYPNDTLKFEYSDVRKIHVTNFDEQMDLAKKFPQLKDKIRFTKKINSI